jgi:hypothetical protein
MSRTAAAVTERFWSKVNKTAGCWNWGASKSKKGYGQFRIGKRVVKAHRVAYELENGLIPAGMDVDHRCHNKACVNPAHLRLATNKQNHENLPGAQANSKSGVRGVSWNKASGKWTAKLQHNGRGIHVGLFPTVEAAAEAVAAKRRELFTHSDMDKPESKKEALLLSFANSNA